MLKSNSGHLHPDTSDIKDLYFLDQENVDSFVDGYYQDTKDSNEVFYFVKLMRVEKCLDVFVQLSFTSKFSYLCFGLLMNRVFIMSFRFLY